MMKEIFESGLESDAPPSNWPFREHSRGRHVAGVRWHYQLMGTGPVLLLAHGSGGSAHSWSHCMAELARTNTVIAVDLPGHGFSNVDRDADALGDVYSLSCMASALAALLRALGLDVARAAGHSAGVAVLVRMALDGLYGGTRIVGFNPALVAPPTPYVDFVAPLLAPFAESALVARGAAWLARSTSVIPSMLGSTGSTLSAEDEDRYAYLCTRPAHCHAALSMMSRWDLPRLVRDAASLTLDLPLYAGVNDRWVPVADLTRSVSRIPAATLTRVEGAGHLIPEERPDVVIAALQTATD